MGWTYPDNLSTDTESTMPVILFVRTANRFRSPVAAAYTESKLRMSGMLGAWVVRSAGTWTTNDEPAHPEAIKATAEFGLDISTHRTHEVNTSLISAADLIVVMEKGYKEARESEFPFCRERIMLLGELAGEGNLEIPDPSKLDFEEGKAVAQMIVAIIDNNFTELLHRAEAMHNSRKDREQMTQ